MSDRPTPLTDANVASLAKAPDCFCEASFARDLERQRKEWMDRTIDALAQAGNLKEQRDAYAETLRIIATANARTHHRAAFTDLISERHPELAENAPMEARPDGASIQQGS